jgi:phytoene dehydrogenase-like protein
VVSSDAKFGSENWFVMINTPPNDGQNWDVLVLEARKNIITKIKNTLSVDIEQYIDFEEIATPVTIEEKTASWRGALYGKNSNSTLSAFQRQANFSKKIKGLYFVGGSVHPGGGIPLAISSAKIAADFIKKDSKLR